MTYELNAWTSILTGARTAGAGGLSELSTGSGLASGACLAVSVGGPVLVTQLRSARGRSIRGHVLYCW